MTADAAAFFLVFMDYVPRAQIGALLIWPALVAEIGESGCDMIRAAVKERGMRLVDDGAGSFFLAA